MSDCPRLGRLFGGCRFRARHDTSEVPEIILMRIDGGDVERLRSRSTYVRDVCETCGRTIEREAATQAARNLAMLRSAL